ncbi:MAG: glutamate-cysteine ligase family protein [Candidatus Helarchaeota archaeon]|nr:glutamate-cysteine ligase family protein [Candidatus Helarchaeota archaeon]
MSNWQISKRPIELPYSMSIEIELQMLTKDGLFLSEEEIIPHMQKMVEESTELFLKDLDTPTFPQLIKDRIVGEPFATQKGNKGSVISLNYNNQKKTMEIDLYKRVAPSILAVVTPHCTILDELVWWCQKLISIAEQALPKDIFLISTGLNPIQQITAGSSCGAYYQIGNFENDKEKINAYNLIRNFIPHIIALSANSPFINGAPTGEVKVTDRQYACPECIRSNRLQYDVSMFSQTDPNYYIPYLPPHQTPNYFLDIIRKPSLEEARFQDIIPFSELGTIELRICDAQLSIARTIGIALIIEALALLSSEMKSIPDAGSQGLITNRDSAISNGLFGMFTVEKIPFREMMQENPKFTEFYLGNIKKNKLHVHIYEAVQNMLLLLRDIFRRERYIETPFLTPILLSAFDGTDIAKAPFTEAEYQLHLYLARQRDISAVLKDLILLTVKCCEDPSYSPISGTVKSF